MFVVKRLNNNVVLANHRNQEIIVKGKGIGFQVKKGDQIEESVIEDIFVPQKSMNLEHLTTMINQVPMDIVMVANKVIEMGRNQLKRELNANLLVALSDHINFAIQRLNQQIYLKNPLQWEIKHLYPLELNIGYQAIDLIKEMMNIQLPQEEAVYFAMHFVNAQMNGEGIHQMMSMTHSMMETIAIIKYHFKIEIDEQLFSFQRFVTHLRFYLMRQLKKESYAVNDDYLIQIIKQKYPQAALCAEKIAQYFKKVKEWDTSEEEKMYLTLHINRMISEI